MSYPKDNNHGIIYEPWHWCFHPAWRPSSLLITNHVNDENKETCIVYTFVAVVDGIWNPEFHDFYKPRHQVIKPIHWNTNKTNLTRSKFLTSKSDQNHQLWPIQYDEDSIWWTQGTHRYSKGSSVFMVCACCDMCVRRQETPLLVI